MCKAQIGGTLKTLAQRVQSLIDDVNDGNVKAAALAMDAFPSTLFRIAIGETRRPTNAVLEQIAGFYHVDVAWLRTGKGVGPKEKSPYAEGFEWRHILRQLKLNTEAATVLAGLPNSTLDVIYKAIVDQPRYEGLQHSGMFDMTPELEAVRRLEWTVWNRLFREWIRLFGRERVRTIVENNLHLFRRQTVNAELTPDERRIIEELNHRLPRSPYEVTLLEFSRGVPISREELDARKEESVAVSRAPSASTADMQKRTARKRTRKRKAG